MPRISRLILSLAFSLPAAFSGSTRADDWLILADQSMRETEESLKSLEGEAVFEVTTKMEGVNAPIVRARGKAKVYFDSGKFHIHLRFDIAPTIIAEEIFVIYDGTTAYKITFSDRISPTGCMGDIYADFEAALQGNGINADDPARLWNHFRVDKLIQLVRAGTVTIEASDMKDDGSVTLRFLHREHNMRFEYDVLAGLDCRPSEYRVFNPSSTIPAHRDSLRWETINGQLYATKYTRDAPSIPQTSSLEYVSFEPNKEVDPQLFTLESADIPIGTRFVDHRINPKNRFQYKTPVGISPMMPDRPYRLVFDEQNESLLLLTEGRFGKYTSTNELGNSVIARAEKELEAIARVCSLTDEQMKPLEAAFTLHDALLVKATMELTAELKVNPVIPAAEIRNYMNRVNQLNLRIKQHYFATDSLSAKVLATQLIQDQRQLLQSHYMSQFVESFGLNVGLNKEQLKSLGQFVSETINSKTEYVFDPQDFLELLMNANRSKLIEILGEQKSSVALATICEYKDVNEFYRQFLLLESREGRAK